MTLNGRGGAKKPETLEESRPLAILSTARSKNQWVSDPRSDCGHLIAPIDWGCAEEKEEVEEGRECRPLASVRLEIATLLETMGEVPMKSLADSGNGSLLGRAGCGGAKGTDSEVKDRRPLASVHLAIANLLTAMSRDPPKSLEGPLMDQAADWGGLKGAEAVNESQPLASLSLLTTICWGSLNSLTDSENGPPAD